MLTSAKGIVLKPVPATAANVFVRRLHYSGKVVKNSQLHLGVFAGDRMEGAMQFGPSLDKSKLRGLVSGTGWYDFLELNRMAFSDRLPRNSESRAISVAMRLIRATYPHIEWIVSYADATQCGDGAIYRGSGFVLTGIKPNANLVKLPSGVVTHKMTLEAHPTAPRTELGGRSYFDVTNGRYDFGVYVRVTGGEVLSGFQLRYVYFLKPEARARLTVPVVPLERIEELGASMYRGEKRSKQATAWSTGERRGSTDPNAPF